MAGQFVVKMWRDLVADGQIGSGALRQNKGYCRMACRF
ncbi:Hypothetical protein RAK1035_0213 [Roseovarius sp. AK1035]|nr:Hypothetical protein RAK1035_0213 [Roseovarius sp. AK1035]